MAYPSNIDTTVQLPTNITPTTPQSNPSHSGQHNYVNAAVVALETVLNAGSAGNPLIASGSAGPPVYSSLLTVTATGLGVGTGATVSARVHSIATTEQLRLGYDSAHYASFTVSSTGSVTISPIGTSPVINFATNGGVNQMTINGAANASVGIGVAPSAGVGLTITQSNGIVANVVAIGFQIVGGIVAVGARPTQISLRSSSNSNVSGQIGLVQVAGADGAHILLIQTIEDTVAWRNVVVCRDGGNFGVATATPNATLDVVGTIRTNQNVANAAVLVTFPAAQGPTGSTAGGPQGWWKVNMSGTDRYIPFW